jgi:hypothetical protein
MPSGGGIHSITATLAGASARKFPGEQRPELQHPPPNGLVRDIQPALCEQIFFIALAEREVGIDPDGVPDDRRLEMVARKRDRHTSIVPIDRTQATTA